MRDLIDPEDGENRAVRAFLMHYGAAGLSVGQMKTNLRMSGWNGCWPAWCDEPGEDKQHLTKAGAQLWLRHLFALESTAGVKGPDEARPFSAVRDCRMEGFCGVPDMCDAEGRCGGVPPTDGVVIPLEGRDG